MEKKYKPLFAVGFVLLAASIACYYAYRFAWQLRINFIVVAVIISLLFLSSAAIFAIIFKHRCADKILQSKDSARLTSAYRKRSGICLISGVVMLALDLIVYWNIIVNSVTVSGAWQTVSVSLLHLIWFILYASAFVAAIAYGSAARAR